MAMTASSGMAQGAGDVASAGQAERSPFVRTTELLAPYQPAKPLITLSVGEPQHPVPDFVGPVLARHTAEFGRYPMAKGIEPFRRAVATWLGSRFQLPRPVDPESEVMVLNGSREGLFFAAITAARYVAPRKGRPAVLMPNPFYPAYGAGARAAGCEQIYLPTTLSNGFLPDLDSIDEATLARTVAFFLASPANPQGSVASRAYFTRLKQLADRHGFMILSDECYSEIYTREAPGSMLECAGPDFTNVVAFQSLSKRSNLPGMRVGFAAGDRKFMAAFLELRNVAAPQVPVPLQHVAVAAYGDEAHVEENRRLYRIKFDLADQILGSRYGYKRPAGGFCVWLDVSDRGGDEATTVRLYRDAGVRVIPGSYLAREQNDGSNPGAGYIRLALVSDSESTAEAMHRLVETLG
ncbi:aminotransferase class I/II-fold pyridoxal phosphate-dependent enzyme [Bradyrhizobium viridifuturi]|jgi:N-succinyldiaminopimelate aminotransferase|uniref:aminotransferase class I/II-fold pyridoxal phosphate-dependent enzyme n=2 Tax=Nitrobacteraceae TaxID=41294 RepID=UPI0003967827|nr:MULTISPECIES: aminotransferase class I/II-fold pyridoxal phosphate-dependent enzyme [Bradyrhizobium]ERF84423.1 MAG: D-alanine transaminase [Bradyrhizobium sp. DFCI-1]OYU63844.1 MAG: aspartate aminotransferase [Bradyrhizobium sp. PARBB1]PSO19988.1 aspartate aminotransferase [Bradyrhizobium sp. MOS004]QRI69829.1 aminotransferase class I/II-fold pyridoxal phosphate-dependent enzyme [Bradyrhizobium sp. PSBB068]MBR1022757.1 aminotransferase class I/II-fold pyridoxal phosphate-dependent enzyme [B